MRRREHLTLIVVFRYAARAVRECNSARSGERTLSPGTTPFDNGQGSVRPQSLASLLFVLSNQIKQTVFFVRIPAVKINAHRFSRKG